MKSVLCFRQKILAHQDGLKMIRFRQIEVYLCSQSRNSQQCSTLYSECTDFLNHPQTSRCSKSLVPAYLESKWWILTFFVVGDFLNGCLFSLAEWVFDVRVISELWSIWCIVFSGPRRTVPEIWISRRRLHLYFSLNLPLLLRERYSPLGFFSVGKKLL